VGELNIKQHDIEGFSAGQRVDLKGAIDGNSLQDLQDFVEQLYEAETEWFIVDMSGIKYVNSTGLGSLVKYADQFKSRGGGMVLFSVPPKVKVIIKMLGLDSFFPIANSLEDALAEARGEGSKAAPSEPEPEPITPAPAPPGTSGSSRRSKENGEPRKASSRSQRPSAPSVPTKVASPSPKSGAQGASAPQGELTSALIDEQRRTNRLLKAVILELRQLRADFEDMDED